MATLPKISAPSGAPAVSAPRAAVPTRVSSMTSPIDEASPGAGLVFDTAVAFGFQEHDPNNTSEQRHSDRRQNPLINGLVNAPSQSFAAMLEENESVDGFTPVNEPGRIRKFANVVAKAIQTYETNAIIISGNAPKAGRELSLNL